jgi:uncharacterized protein
MLTPLLPALLLSLISVPTAMEEPGDYPIAPVPFTDVKVRDTFWAPRLAISLKETIPHCFEQCEKTGRLANFARAGGLEEGGFQGIYFNDSDVYKIIEGASYALQIAPDPELDAYLDELIAKIAAAQEDDGYLYCARTLADDQYQPPGGLERWTDPNGHELYNVGHLYEGAVAHFLATGKRSLLEVALKNADLICDLFGEDGEQVWPPGHQEIEMGLVKLYRLTGEEKYISQAERFLELRGRPEGRNHGLFGEYSQDHEPVEEQSRAVGHAVRAAYLYSGMADVAALLGREDYVDALERIWADVARSKLYLNGGIGAAGGNEGFGAEFELPNLVAYCETCASIATVLWNQRMFQLLGRSEFIDVLERSLYNGLISGISLDGRSFFYPNPLESDGRHQRSPWFGCACCPSNVARLVPSMPGYVFATSGDELYVNLFVGNTARVQLESGAVNVKVETDYPWDGTVRLTIVPTRPGQEFTLKLRIPGWARNEPAPGGLYRFAESVEEQPTLSLRRVGELPLQLEDGYATIRRAWQPDDIVTLELPMPVRRVLCDERVEADRGKAALQRGPLVYCVEWPDVENGKVVNLVLSDAAELTVAREEELLGGISVLRGEVSSTEWSGSGEAREVRSDTIPFTAIPYYAWAHRGRGEMAVWLARDLSAARPLQAPTIASRAKATASGGEARALNDQLEPKSSGDHSNRFLHWWPRKGTTEWVQYDFTEPTTVRAVEVYWFDDTGRGECRLPSSWELFYLDRGAWKPVTGASGFGREPDRYNRTTFEAVTTEALRLEVQLPEKMSAGIHEWRVE